MKKIAFKVLVIALLSTATAFCFTTNSTSALRGNNTDLLKISLLRGGELCYASGDGFVKSSGIIKANFDNYGFEALVGTDNTNIVLLPTGVDNTISDMNLTCKETFNGYTGGAQHVKGLLTLYTKPAEITKYGYKKSESSTGSSENTVSFSIEVKDGSGQNAIPTTNNGGAITCQGEKQNGNSEYWYIEQCSGEIDISYEDEKGKDWNYNLRGYSGWFSATGYYRIDPAYGGHVQLEGTSARSDLMMQYMEDGNGTLRGNTLKDAIQPVLQFVKSDLGQVFGSGPYSDPQVTFTYKNTQSSPGDEYEFMDSDRTKVGRYALQAISGGATSDYITTETTPFYMSTASWSNPYIYNLYYQYLTTEVKANSGIKVYGCAEGLPTDGAAYYFKNKPNEWCPVSISNDASSVLDKEYTTLKETNGVDLKKGTWKDIFDFFKNESNYADFKLDDYANATFTDTGDPDEPPTGEDPANKDNCYKEAGPLGWILCPLIETMGTFIVQQYAALVEPALEINTELFNTSSGTYAAWNVFRNIANVAFVVLFIIVVISQVTGVGIDNYGIKKILPKLIISAILINLSYIVCQAAIDVGNIVGGGIGGLFQQITDKISDYSGTIPVEGVPVDSGTVHDWGSSFMSNFWGSSALVTIVLAIGLGTVLSQGLAIIIPVLMAILSIAIAIVGLIIILGIRQAAAVLLVVVAPLALACYMLPNTKPIYDKWLKAFEGLLLAYPTCSALVYGGDMASAILLKAAGGTTHNTWLLISAAAIGIAPIFIIPKVIVKSMGAISGGIMNFTNRVGGRGKGMARNRLEQSRLTDRRNYNRNMRAQKAFARTGEYNAKRGNRTVSRYKARGMNPSNMSARQRRKYNVALGAVNAHNAELENAYRTDFTGKGDGVITDRLMNAASSGKLDINMLAGGLSAIHDEDQLTAALFKISGTQAYRDLMKNNPEAIQRIGGVMASRRDSVINQSIGKIMASGQDIRTQSGALDTDAIRKKVQGAGTGVMASQNKDVFKTEGAAELFSDEQLRAAAAAGYSGSTAANFYSMMQDVDDGRKQTIVAGMTAEQVASLTMQEFDGKEVGSLAAVGGAGLVTSANQEAINTLNSDDGQNLRTKMSSQVKEALGVKSGDNSGGDVNMQDEVGYWMYQENKSGPSSMREGDMASGGGSEEGAPVSGGGGGAPATPAVDVSSMTEDDYRYIQWQHNRNGEQANNGPSESGDMSLTINHNEVAAPTAPDLSPREDTGTNSRTGKARAKAGNHFDYMPREKGQSAEQYSAEARWQKEMREVTENARTRKEGESREEYQQYLGSIGYKNFGDWSAENGVTVGTGRVNSSYTAAEIVGTSEPSAPAEPSAPINNSSEFSGGGMDIPAPSRDTVGGSMSPIITSSTESTPNPDAHIVLDEAQPNPDAHIVLEGDRPNPDAHIVLDEAKPNPNAHIILEGDQPNPDPHIILGDGSRHNIAPKEESRAEETPTKPTESEFRAEEAPANPAEPEQPRAIFSNPESAPEPAPVQEPTHNSVPEPIPEPAHHEESAPEPPRSEEPAPRTIVSSQPEEAPRPRPASRPSNNFGEEMRARQEALARKREEMERIQQRTNEAFHQMNRTAERRIGGAGRDGASLLDTGESRQSKNRRALFNSRRYRPPKKK